jgi:hypothetical protein
VVQPVLAGFTLAGAGSPNGGTVTMASPPATGTKLVVAREMVIKQLIDLRNQGKFFPETHEEAFDILTMLIQQVSERVDRAVKVDISGDSDPDALVQGISNVAAAAQASANNAANSASASASSAAASAASAAAADTAKNKAQQWAENPEDSPVEPGFFSAKHWAAKAMAALSGLLARVTDLENKRLSLGTAKSAASGTAIDFTGIPSSAKRLTVTINGVSTNGASLVQLQLGTASGIESTGYACSVDTTASSGSAPIDVTTGLALDRAGGSASNSSRNGTATFALQAGNTWVATYLGRSGVSSGMSLAAGGKTLSGTLDRIRLTTVNGTDAFDAGSVNIMWEG